MDMFEEIKANERERMVVGMAMRCIRTGNSQMFKGKLMKSKTLIKKAIEFGSLNIDIALIIADEYHENNMLTGLKLSRAADNIFNQAKELFESFNIKALNTHNYEIDEIEGVEIYYKYPRDIYTAYAVYINNCDLDMIELYVGDKNL